MNARILVVDNDADMVSLLERHLQSEGWAVTAVHKPADALTRLAQEHFDVVVADLVMDEIGGLDILAAVRQTQPQARVILMTAFGTLENAIAAMRQGAFDYLTKPFKLDQVTVAVERALEDRRVREENRRMREALADKFGFENILGRSKAMQAVFDRVRAVADSEATVLLLGESGTGKELVARAIHQHSRRREGPFVAVNCAAIPETLLESELFGHEKGSFTGADRRRRGLFAEAHGGTLFLDEVGDIPAGLQPKLLRALQERAIRPVGGNQAMDVDLRVISATNRDLAARVREGAFRDDLYYRLAVIPIRLPSLRERPEDIPLLAQHFLDRAARALDKPITGFDREASDWLLRHTWPGNVRELENMVERAVTLARGPEVTRADLGTEFASATGGIADGVRPSLAELEDQYVRRVLDETRGDKLAAARILGISVRTLQRRFK